MDDLQFLDKLADFLDNRFRIPFTRIRFGMDAVIGLVPYAADAFFVHLCSWKAAVVDFFIKGKKCTKHPHEKGQSLNIAPTILPPKMTIWLAKNPLKFSWPMAPLVNASK